MDRRSDNVQAWSPQAFTLTTARPLANKRQSVKLNSRTLKIAEESKKNKLVLYVWVALNNHIFYGNKSPSLGRLAEECGSKHASIKCALEWLAEFDYITMHTNKTGERVYELR